MPRPYKTSDGEVIPIDRSELFGDELGGRGGFSFFTMEGAKFVFGPESTSKIKLPRGLCLNNGKLQKIGDLLFRGYSTNYICKKLKCADRTVTTLRKILEVNSGVAFKCPCGRKAGHRSFCKFRPAKPSGRRCLTLEKVRTIRALYDPKHVGSYKLADRFDVSPSTVMDVVKFRIWKPLPLRSAWPKQRYILKRMKLLAHHVEKLYQGRSLANASRIEDPRIEKRFDDALNAMRDAIAKMILQQESINKLTRLTVDEAAALTGT